MIPRRALPCLLALTLWLVPPARSMGDDDRVGACTWKGCHRGAVSFSVDDSHASCFLSLEWSGIPGTYYAITPVEPSIRLLRYPQMLAVNELGHGHEIGSHTVNHPCSDVPAAVMEEEFARSIEELQSKLGVAREEIVTLGWPCGFVQHQDLAAEYFLGARGYKQEQGLEDPTPRDMMNLRAFDVRQLDDAKLLVVEAEQQGKWLNLVFHRWCPDDGSIPFSTTRDVWIATVGDVVKYIVKRDGLRFGEVEADDAGVRFSVTRSKVPPSRVRDFEEVFHPGDTITLRVRLGEGAEVAGVRLDGAETDHVVREIDGVRYVLVELPAKGGDTSRIEVRY